MLPGAERGVLGHPSGFGGDAGDARLRGFGHCARSDPDARRCPNDRRGRDLLSWHARAEQLVARPRRPHHARIWPAARPTPRLRGGPSHSAWDWRRRRDRNLWPEPRRSIEPQWNAEAKDRLEWRMRELICSGQLDVREAQRMMAEDWVDAYGRFFPRAAEAMEPR